VRRWVTFLRRCGSELVGAHIAWCHRLLLLDSAANLALVLDKVYSVSVELFFNFVKLMLLFLFLSADIFTELGSKVI
jgi:hypothetical protein